MIVDPSTGEILELEDATLDLLGTALADLRQKEQQLRDARKEIEREVLARMDRDASWTVHAGDVKLEGQSPGRVTYEGQSLLNALTAFAHAGEISPEALDAAVRRVETLKVNVSALNRIAKLGGDVAAVIHAAAMPDPRPRSVRVTVRS